MCWLACLFAFTFPLQGTEPSPTPEPSHVVIRLEKQYSQVEKLLKNRTDKKADTKGKALEMMASMEAIYRSGKELPANTPKSSLWKDYCQASLDILSDVEHQLGIGYPQQALRSLKRLKSLQSQIHPDFKPGLWRRILGWLGWD